METMNIYVVSSGWASDGSGGGVVVGAAVDLSSAKDIADRMPGDMPGGWGDWESDPGPGPQALRWARRGIGQCRQEIVCVPLAGWISTPGQVTVTGSVRAKFGDDLLSRLNGGPSIITTPRD